MIGDASAKAYSQQGAGASGRYNEATALKAPQAALLDDVREALEVAVKEISAISSELRSFSDQTLGVRPENGIGGAELPSTPIRAEQVRERMGWLRGAINELRDQANRLNAI